MKILITALPRTSSKRLQRNLICYQKAKYQQSATCIVAPGTQLLDQWFEKTNGGAWYNGHFIRDNDDFLFVDQPIQIGMEFYSRIKLLENYDKNCVVKIHPMSINAILAIEQLSKTFDRHFILYREDFFEQCLSCVLSQKFGMYVPGIEQQNTIKFYKENPFVCDWNWLNCKMYQTHRILSYLETRWPQKIMYSCESLVKCTSAESLCEYLELDPIDWEFDNFFNEEWQDNKKDMITNYDTLKNAAHKYYPSRVPVRFL